MFGSDMPNVAIPLAKQIQAVFDTFADEKWTRPSHDKWWTQREEAHKAGKAVEQVLFGAAQTLIDNVDVSKIQQDAGKRTINSSNNTNNSKM